MKKRKTRTLSISAALLSCGALSGQNTVSQIFNVSKSWTGPTFDLDGTPLGPGSYNGSETEIVTFDSFDSSLGNLTGIEFCFEANGNFESMADYYNPDGVALPTINVTNEQGFRYWIRRTDLPFGTFTYVAGENVTGIQNFSVSSNSAPGAWVMSPDDYATGNINFTGSDSVGASQFTEWTDQGTIDVQFETSIFQEATYSQTPPGGTTPGAQGSLNTHWEEVDWSGTLTLKYHYTIPEPSTALLAFLGMTFGVARRRRS